MREAHMTESEWLACEDPAPMLEALQSSGKVSPRKVRLFAVACCRRISHLLVHDISKRAVALAEQFADRLATDEELLECNTQAEEVWACLTDTFWSRPMNPNNEYDAAVLSKGIHLGAISGAAGAVTAAVGGLEGEASVLTTARYASEAAGWVNVTFGEEYENSRDVAAEQAARAVLLRDIFPFPAAPAADPAWLGGAVQCLAQVIYDERAFDQLPILGDALEDAGCHDERILGHCRQAEGHVRGCWLVDLLLGKE
jgi:hypothetical protein